MAPPDPHATITAVWRAEAARLIAGLTRMTHDLALAEDLAQDALVSALEQWPEAGVPDNPGAWLMAVSKRRAVDHFRRASRLRSLAPALAEEPVMPDLDAAVDFIEDDVLRLMFMSCHPVLTAETRVALTLRLVGGLSTREIARAYLSSEATVAQRISRAKRTLAEAGVPFEVPTGPERADRLASVLEVVYLVFNEGYSATAGDDWLRPALCDEAIRLGRLLVSLAPREPEAHGLLALMQLQASRTAARIGPDGSAVLLAEQDRSRWDPALIAAGLASLERAAATRRRPVHAPGGDRGLPRPGAVGGGDGLDPDRRPVHVAGRGDRLAGGGAQPGGRGVPRVRSGGGAGAGRLAGVGAGAAGLPPAAQRARRPAGRARAAG